MKVAITNTYVRGFKKLQRHLQEETYNLILEIGAWPNVPPGRHVEKIRDGPDGPIYSARLAHHYRISFEVFPQLIRLRDVGPHDEVYARERGG
jgi:mRNA-degrading endonuclease RelE of RelBE toxin-antitoxin system